MLILTLVQLTFFKRLEKQCCCEKKKNEHLADWVEKTASLRVIWKDRLKGLRTL